MRIHNIGLMAALLASTALWAPADAAGGGAPANAPVTETKTVIKQNGIKRPDAGTVTGKLWDIADEESKKIGRPAPRKVVVDRYMAEQPGANNATANTQYARWVTFNGASEILKKARADEKAAKSAEADKAKADKKAEAEAKKQAKEAEKAAKAEAKAKEKAEKEAAKAAEKAKKDAEAKAAAEAKTKAEAEAAAAAAKAKPAK